MLMDVSRVVLVGIDGASYRLIDPLVRAGRLPNIARFIERGFHGVLRSTVPPVSPVAWTSMVTGALPCRHGIFDFTGKVPGAYDFRVNTAQNRLTKPLWTHLSEAGKRVLVMGVTMTYPPDPVNGYMVSGLGAPPQAETRSLVHPPEFAAMVNEPGPYRHVPEANLRALSDSDAEKDKYLAGIDEQIRHRVALFRSMWAREKFDFSMLFFLDTDGASHYYWKYMDDPASRFSGAIARVYEAVDRAVGEVLDIVGADASVMLASDHGFGPLRRVLFLNNWLGERGYLVFGKRGLRALVRALRGMPRTEIDWSRTRAYFSGTIGNIFVNLKGREPEGTVEPSEYDALCETLKREFLEFRDPASGEQVIEAVYTRAEICPSGPPSAPDLVLTFRPGFSVVGDEMRLHGLRDKGRVMDDSFNWSGIHEAEGIVMGLGEPFREGGTRGEADIVDISPTILYLLGVPVPRALDGKVMAEAVGDAYREAHAVQMGDASAEGSGGAARLSPEELDQISEQLRNLGYIE
jgi:predicted AlkP superfamily phosphohydrolase/phosphomutase